MTRARDGRVSASPLRRPMAISAAGLVCLSCLAWWLFTSSPSIESLLVTAQQRLDQRRFAEAEALAKQVLIKRPTDCQAALVAARAAAALHQDANALAHLRSPMDQPVSDCAPCLRFAAELTRRMGRARDLEQILTRLATADPPEIEAVNQLAYLLGVEGRAFEALHPLFIALKSGRFTPDHLIMLAAGEPVVNDTAFVERCRTAVPDDPLPLLGRAREALGSQDFGVAGPLLRQIVAGVPDSQEAQARWGLFLQQQGREAEFLAWHAELPETISHPEIWVVRAQWARQRGEPRVAMRCFWEALRLDPNHRLACYQLGQLLQEAGQGDSAAACFKRAALLEQLAYLVDRIYENPQSTYLMSEASDLTESLGRIWEAWGWAYGLSQSTPTSEARERLLQLQSRLSPELPRTVRQSQLGLTLNLVDQPLPQWGIPSPGADGRVAERGDSSVRFDDVAASVGLDFQYDNGHEAQAETTRMLESMGGGVAVLDYDQDGWPDLYLTQAGPWELVANQSRPPDALFQNRLGQAFANVTGASGLGDLEFSQGCTVGDFDGDGFADLYVANIGRNRLYRNQGDGTYRDVTEAAGIMAERWTNSCLLADINGDGLPDLYDVNYLSIAQAPRTLCIRGEEARTCGPGSFHAEPDQLYVNLGDGRFEDVSVASGIDVPNGKGLGIVAADFAGTGRLNLFIANDSVPNFYFVNQTSAAGELPKFTDEALVSGLALSHDGLSAAWMGVAAGDANGDGRLDLFSTTYADQAKSLFIQEAQGGAFTDAIVASGLNPPTWKLLGFGTQFIDGELDGWQDLIVTNGHVFDLSHLHQAYHMPTQYFRNLGKAKFSEVPAERLGPYFAGKYLGRGLARLDWNRDGLDDCAVSNMQAPAALLTNRTAIHGHFLTLRLVGTQTSRDAIGTRVTVKAGDQSWTQQLTAGDGYQASNERKLHFGLGPKTQVEEVTIHWLGGQSQTLAGLMADSEWLIVEGQPQARRLSPQIMVPEP